MYNIAKGKQEFWTAFGQYMAPILSAEGERTNWVNYKTGLRHIYFRTDAGRDFASIAIELRHPDALMRKDIMNRLLGMKDIFTNTMNEEWIWESEVRDEHGSLYSRIFIETKNVNLFNQQDWPAIISFFKPRLIALDEFWSQVKYMFE